MKTITKNKIKKAAQILKNSQFDYVYCGETPNAEYMQGCINQIDDNLKLISIAKLSADISDNLEDTDVSEVKTANDLARHMASYVGAVNCVCKYQGVTFYIY